MVGWLVVDWLVGCRLVVGWLLVGCCLVVGWLVGWLLLGCRLVADWFPIEWRLSGDLCPYGLVLDCQLPIHCGEVVPRSFTGLTWSVPMRANVLPICDGPVSTIGADRCVEGPDR